MKRIFPSRTSGLALLFLAASVASAARAQNVIPIATTTVINPNASVAAVTGVAAEVNGEKIMMGDLNRLVDAIKAQEPSLSTGSPEATKALTQIKAQQLDEMINSMLLSQEARRRKIVADPKAVDDAVASIRGGFKTDADFKATLAKDGKTPDDVKKIITNELAVRELAKQMTSDVTVSNDDIATFYRANIAQFTIPEGVRARHILLAINPNAPDAQKDQVRKRAMELIRQLNAKADFAAIAKANSDDQGTKDTGGDLGAFTHGQMAKPFEDAAFAAPVGKIVGPIQTDYGLHILRVDEKIPAKVIPLATIQADPQVKAVLLKQEVQKRLDDNITQLKKVAKIKNNLG